MLPWLPARSSGATTGRSEPSIATAAHAPRLPSSSWLAVGIFPRREAGQELVEFALILPLLLLLFLGIIEFGRAMLAYNTIANAAREGARYGIVTPIEANIRGVSVRVHRSGWVDPGRPKSSSLDQHRGSWRPVAGPY